MSKSIDNLCPTGGGAMLLAVGASHRELRSSGSGGQSKNNSGHGIKYTGETYSGGDDSYTAGITPKINEMAKAYENVEGSLFWLHKKEPIRFPYDSVCLGYSDEQSEEHYLSIKETLEAMEYLYSIYTNSELAIATGMSRSRLSNYKRGVSKAPLELLDFVKKLKQAA